MPQRLNDCSEMGMRRNGKSPVGILCERELVTKLAMRMGRNGNSLDGNGKDGNTNEPFPVISTRFTDPEKMND